jgi:hypothetical protein
LVFTERELSLMRNAPGAVGKLVSLVAVGVAVLEALSFWFFFEWFYAERFRILDEQIRLRDIRIEQLEKQEKQTQGEEGRHLSAEEERELIRSLSALGPHGVIVDHESGDDEAHAFAEELAAMFKAVPGWRVNGSNHIVQLGPRETGVFFIVSDQGEIPQAVAMVMASLKRQEIVFSLRKRTPTPENHLGPRIFNVFVRSRG